MKAFKKEHLPLIAVSVFYFVTLILLWGHLGDPIVDCAREAYIPQRLNEGAKLFKDILCIYGPLSYMINAFFFKFFGANLNVLWVLGSFATYAIIICYYLISKEFFSKLFSASLCILLISVCVFSPSVFNYIFPYSYAMLYSFCAFILCVLFLLYYIKGSKIEFAYLSSLFFGLSLTNKYDYLPFILVFIFVFSYLKPIKKEDVFKCIGAFLLIPFITYLYLMIWGVTFNEFFSMAQIVQKMALAPSMKILYTYVSGTYFSLPALYLNSIQFLKTSFVLSLSILGMIFCFKIKDKIARSVALLIPLLAFYFSYDLIGLNKGFSFFPLLVFIISIYNIKNIKKKPLYFFLLLAAVFGSFKTFYFLQLAPYGTFTLPLLILALSASLKEFLLQRGKLKEGHIEIPLISTVLLISFIFLSNNIHTALKVKNIKFPSAKGTMYMSSYYWSSHNDLKEYIENYSKTTDKIVILPEGPLLNFLTNRKSDDYYNSLIPLYFDTFKEENIIKHFKETKPEYFVFNIRKTEDYGKNLICVDYGQNFCSWVFDNYELVMQESENFKFAVFKRLEKNGKNSHTTLRMP